MLYTINVLVLVLVLYFQGKHGFNTQNLNMEKRKFGGQKRRFNKDISIWFARKSLVIR